MKRAVKIGGASWLTATSCSGLQPYESHCFRVTTAKMFSKWCHQFKIALLSLQRCLSSLNWGTWCHPWSLTPLDFSGWTCYIINMWNVTYMLEKNVILNKTIENIQMTGGYFQGHKDTCSRPIFLLMNGLAATLRVKSQSFQTGICNLFRLRLCGQDTCLLCLLSGRLSMPGVEHTCHTHHLFPPTLLAWTNMAWSR